MQNASGQATLKNSLKTSLKTFLLRPHKLIFSKPFGLICMLYGGTYLTANTLDTLTSTVQNKPATLVTSGTSKFAASSTANISLCLFKDQALWARRATSTCSSALVRTVHPPRLYDDFCQL